MMNDKVLIVGSGICLLLGLLRPIEGLLPVGFLMLVMAEAVSKRG